MKIKEDYLINEFNTDLEHLQNKLGDNETINLYLQWMILRELDFISKDVREMTEKSEE